MKRAPIIAAAILIPVAAALVAGLWWVSRPRTPAAEASREPIAQAPASPSSAASEPAIRYPIDAAQTGPSAAPLDFQGALDDLFGARTVASMFLVDDFARRLVATVDNLGRSSASSRLWPVVPAAGRQLCWTTTLVAMKRPAGTCTASSPTIEPFAGQTNCARQPGSLLSM